MKLTIPKDQLGDNPGNVLRRAGYAYFRDPHTGTESYIRRLTRNFYPRFHCYIFDQGGLITFNLHLDQRQTRYEGQTAHAGEYDGDLVREEMERLQAVIDNRRATGEESFADVVGSSEAKPKKSWWPF